MPAAGAGTLGPALRRPEFGTARRPCRPRGDSGEGCGERSRLSAKHQHKMRGDDGSWLEREKPQPGWGRRAHGLGKGGREEGRGRRRRRRRPARPRPAPRAAAAPPPGCLPRQGRRKMAGRRAPRSYSPSPLPGCSRRPAPASTPPARRPRNEAAPAAREGLCLPQRGAGGGGGRLP